MKSDKFVGLVYSTINMVKRASVESLLLDFLKENETKNKIRKCEEYMQKREELVAQITIDILRTGGEENY